MKGQAVVGLDSFSPSHRVKNVLDLRAKQEVSTLLSQLWVLLCPVFFTKVQRSVTLNLLYYSRAPTCTMKPVLLGARCMLGCFWVYLFIFCLN